MNASVTAPGLDLENEHAAEARPLLAWLPLVAKAQETETQEPEDEPLRYASPPCYLAETFADESDADAAP